MKIDIVTLFPEMFAGIFDTSILKRAQENKFVEINLHNLRDWANDKHKTVDDTPCGGGAGMVLKVDVMDRCLANLKDTKEKRNKKKETGANSKFQIPNSKLEYKKKETRSSRTILLTPQGNTFDQDKARELSKVDHMILICGHYEGFDQRIRDHLVDEEISIGDYVLTGGEIPAMIVTDAVSRLVPGVIKQESHMKESFSVKPVKASSTTPGSARPKGPPSGLSAPFSKGENNKTLTEPKYLEYPHYTRPVEYKRWKVPDVLLSGNHGKIEKWRNDNIKKKP